MNLSPRRRFLYWLNTVVMVLLMLAFLVGVNLVAHTKFARIDMTADKVWEVSPASSQILKSINNDVDVYINPVGDAMSQDKALPEAWRRTQQLLYEMASLNSKIRVFSISENPRAQANVISLLGRPEPNMLYFVYKPPGADKPITRSASIGDFFQANQQTGEVLDFYGESRIITTISQLISDRKFRIYHTVGHKEIPTQVSDRRGLSTIEARLIAVENVEFKPLDLARDKAVPDDADMVMIAAPFVDFTTAETEALTKYWGRGGRFFVAVHPLIPDPLVEFRRFLESCGIRLNRDIVVESQPERGDAGVVVVRQFSNHPVNQYMHELAFLVPYTCSVDAQAVRKGMQAMPLFFSSRESWAEQDLPPKAGSKQSPGEPWGPCPLAAASQEEFSATGKPARMVVWGGFYALTNQYNLIGAEPNPITMSYIVNNFRWLMEREVLVTTPSRKPRMKPFAPPPGADLVILLISLAGIPLLGVALGGLAWYFRRK